MKRIVANEPDRVGAWVCAQIGGTYTGVDSASIGLEEDGEIIAGVMFDHWNGRSIAMHVAAKSDKKWMTRGYLRFCFWYPFEQLKVKKIIGLVDESNKAARKFDENLGFALEARIKDACIGGDLLIYSMTKERCRFLERRYGNKTGTPPSP